MKRIIFFVLLIVFAFVTPSFAFTNICENVKKALGMTSTQMKEFYKDEFENHRVEGSGVVFDVRTNNFQGCTIVVSCGSDAFIYIKEDDCRGSVKDLKIGQAISFTGDCSSFDWEYYQNSDKRYIRAFVYNPFLKY